MPAYDLVQVKIAAKAQNIEYRGRKVAIDIANLGYDLQDVVHCLCQLQNSDFRKTHKYPHKPHDDEYIFSYKYGPRADQVDRLYIKFCLLEDYLIIDLASFHLPQF